MATCKDCVYINVCKSAIMGSAIVKRINGCFINLDEAKEQVIKEYYESCNHFKDRSRFVELPCKVGDLIYIIKKARGLSVRGAKVSSITITESGKIQVSCYRSSFIGFWGDDAFATKEEAERALKGVNICKN